MSIATQTFWLERLAHDLRGPLTPIQSAIYLLRRGPDNPAEHEQLLEIVDRQMQRMAGMIDEIADWVRADQGRLLDRTERVDIRLAIDACLAILPSASWPRIAYDGGGDGIEVNGDARRLAELMKTLFLIGGSQAVASHVRVRTVAAGDGSRWAHVERRLPAGAIALEVLPVLFKNPEPDPEEGLGLRPLIADAIARAHGGELDAYGDLGAITLALRLPMMAPELRRPND